MIKKWGIRLLLAIVIIVAIIIYTAPAEILEKGINSNTSTLKITSSSGGLIKGDFQNIKFKGGQLNQLHWNISLIQLLTGKIAATLNISDPKFDGQFNIEHSISGTTRLFDINAVQSTAHFATQWAPLKYIHPEGELLWNNVALSFTEQSFIDASGEISWNNAQLTVNGQNIPLGNINVFPTTDNNDLLLLISSDSVLDIDATLKISLDHTYLLDVSLKEDLPSNIKNSIKYVARPDGNGRLTFTLPGRW